MVKEKNEVFTLENFGFSNKYKLVLHNDDKTPYLYVLFVLITRLSIDENSAMIMTATAHKDGKATIGYFATEEEAENQKKLVDEANAETGMSLLVTVEEDN